MVVVFATWVLVLMGAMGLFVANAVHTQRLATDNALAVAQLRAMCLSGLEIAAENLVSARAGRGPLVAAAVDFGPDPIRSGQHWVVLGHRERSTGTASWLPTLEDEQSRLPLRMLTASRAARIPGMAPGALAALLEMRRIWQDDVFPELHTLPELDDASLDIAAQYLSRFGTGVNLNTASEGVLVVLGLSPHCVERVMAWRTGPDGIPNSADDRLFRTLDAGGEWARNGGFDHDSVVLLSYLGSVGELTVASTHYEVSVITGADESSMRYELSAILAVDYDGRISIAESHGGLIGGAR